MSRVSGKKDGTRNSQRHATHWGQIADVAYQHGDFDEALRIRREVQLPVFERLGDAHEAAVPRGHIAKIAYQRGEYDEAAELQRNRFEVAKDLIDHAELLSGKRVTAIVITETRTIDLRSLTPDQLIDLAAAEDDA